MKEFKRYVKSLKADELLKQYLINNESWKFNELEGNKLKADNYFSKYLILENELLTRLETTSLNTNNVIPFKQKHTFY